MVLCGFSILYILQAQSEKTTKQKRIQSVWEKIFIELLAQKKEKLYLCANPTYTIVIS